MRKKPRTDRTRAAESADPTPPPETAPEPDPSTLEPSMPDAMTGEAETLDDEMSKLAAEMADLEDRHLRLAAEFDNFRKRTARERAEIRSRGQAELIARFIDFLDDLDRVAELDPEQVSTRDVVDGVALADRNLRRQLEAAGLERIGEEGDPFDPNVMEAMGSIPTDDPARDHSVAIVFQPGYRFGGHLVRPARVQVHVHQGGAGDDA